MDVTNKFWHSPDLLLMLLPYLDVTSTCVLVNAQPLGLDVLKHKFVWKGLLKRWPSPGDDELEHIKQLANILNMMEQPETLLLDLLDIICEYVEFEEEEEEDLFNSIRLNYRRHEAIFCASKILSC